MPTDNEIKQIVKERYGNIAVKNSSCCGPKSKVIDYSSLQEDYSNLDGYVADADLHLGCGLPTRYAGIKKGDTVVDLGSGAGNDVFVARALVGEEGRVIGIDFTEEMIDKANRNNAKIGYSNVEFRFGEIESIPLEDNTTDVVVSNCVLNLVPDKENAFTEMYRIIKPGGHFCVSDIVLKGELPEGLKKSAAMYAGCVTGAIQQKEYLALLEKTGFKNVEVKKAKVIDLPENILNNFLSDAEMKIFRESDIGIFSITVVGYKN